MSAEHTNITLPPRVSSRGHQRSRTTVDLPPLFTRTPSVSPTRSSNFLTFGRKSQELSPNSRTSSDSNGSDALTSETQRKIKPGTVGKIASWFEGASEPVNITLVPSPKKEEPEPFYKLKTSENSPNGSTNMDNFTQRTRKGTASQSNSANNSRFSFFKKNPSIQTKIDPDELTRMDVREALLPDGQADVVTPTAFKNLQLSAESLLRRFQSSYTENLLALRKITSEKNIQADELEAAQTRNEHLKMQLLEMAEKASDQEKVIASLKSQLAEPPSTVRMINDDEPHSSRKCDHRNRFSDVSLSSDSYVDSDMSSAISVFSDVESIRTPSTSVAPSPMMRHASLHNTTVVHRTQVQPEVTSILVQQCQKCHNVPVSEAWEVIEMMKLESAGLKKRLTELESAHESALDFLGSLHL